LLRFMVVSGTGILGRGFAPTPAQTLFSTYLLPGKPAVGMFGMSRRAFP
jgi:hypothetical protein